MSVIVHLVPAGEWPGIDTAAEYRPATLESGGYVPCVAPDRTVPAAEALFSGRDDVLAVCLDTDALDAPVEYEGAGGTAPDDAEGDESTAPADGVPHVYGPLNPEAVVAVVPLPRDDGGFSLPEELRELGRG